MILSQALSNGSLIFLILAIGLALGFEFVNGFHDTANAVATVIYTHTLPAWIAVIWSGCWNLIGVLTSSGAVAFSILALLPVELVLNVGSGAGFAMVFALLISAIIWNLGTWYLGLPASSSHTLVGSIMGVGLANAMLKAGSKFGDGVNWAKAEEVFKSLLISPVVGFVCAALLLLVAKALIKRPELYTAPEKDTPPPPWIRGLLILTCTGVSFFHGSNDGQKGMGLLLLILIGILPATYALNMESDADALRRLQQTTLAAQPVFVSHAGGAHVDDAMAELSSYLKTDGKLTEKVYAADVTINARIIETLGTKTAMDAVPAEKRRDLRSDIYLVSASVGKMMKAKAITRESEAAAFKDLNKELNGVTQHVPTWVKIAIAVSLGLGTMIGWKRIVVTVGEKIGKEHLTYAQGASAEIVAMATIGAADWFGMPVSTTHVLSSGVAGTMAANHSGLQLNTLRNLLMAWILTLPVCVMLGAATFAGGLYIVINHLIAHAVIVVAVCLLAAAALLFRRIVAMKKKDDAATLAVAG